MQYLLDTGVLLRLVIHSDPLHGRVRRAVVLLKDQKHQVVTLSQNMAEFWNVCTRPTTARGGFGFSISSTEYRLRMIERAVSILPERPQAYLEWKRLLLEQKVLGVAVHDARIVAGMWAYGIKHLLTLNSGDFKRYTGITVLEPEEVIAASA